MNEEKGTVEEQVGGEESDELQATASRARNRTVMLTPEMTGQVRALLHQDPSEHPQESAEDPLEDFLPPLVDWDAQDDGAAVAAPEAVFSPEPVVDEVFAEEEAPAFDPMTMLAPPVQPEPSVSREEPQMTTRPQQPAPPAPAAPVAPAAPAATPRAPQPAPAAAASRPLQASFSVNPQARAPRAPAETQAVSSTGKTKIVAFLISFDSDENGEVYEIRSGRWLITSRPTDHGEFILINDETISPLHAIVRATKDGAVQVLDQLSEYGTGVQKVGESEEIDVAGGLENVAHGDMIRFGQRRFIVCLVPQTSEDSEE